MVYCFILELNGSYYKTWSARLKSKAKSEGYNLIATIKGRDISVFGKELLLLPHSIKSVPGDPSIRFFAIAGHGRRKVSGSR